MTTEAIELADMIDRSEETTGFERRMASVMRAQAAEIERLKLQLLSASEGTKDREHAEKYFKQAEKLLTANEQTLHAEIERLRAAQAHAVMPLIGPLLDAWECCSQDVRSEHPELDKQLRRINRAMEDAGA